MSTCNPALKTKDLAICASEITLGSCSVLSGNVDVYLKNHTTGKLERKTVTTNAGGQITLNFNSEFNLIENHDYECWVVASGQGVGDRLSLTISGAAAVTDSVALRFKRILEDNATATIATQTVKAL